MLTPMTEQRLREIRDFKPGPVSLQPSKNCLRERERERSERTMSPARIVTGARRYVLDANALVGFFEDRAELPKKLSAFCTTR